MGFRRASVPAHPPEGADQLTADMVGIGMLFAGKGRPEPNIEDTLSFAALEGLEREDFRVLSVLCSWLDVHSQWVNADRLVTLADSQTSRRVRAFWAAVGHWKRKDRRFSKLLRLHRGAPVDLLGAGQQFQLRRFGEDPRFAQSALRVDARILRERKADVATPAELARAHSTYRWRLIIGPTYRADLWAALEREPDLSVAELARRAYSSIGAAWAAKRDHRTVAQARGLG